MRNQRLTLKESVVQTRSIRKSGKWLFPLMLVATIFQNYYDLKNILGGENLALYSYDGPLIFKLGKDLIYFALILSIMFFAVKVRRIPLNNSSLMFFQLVVALCLVSAVTNGPLIGILGLRWALPFLIFLALRDWTRAFDTQCAVRWIFMGLFVCLLLQIYQIFKMPPIFGEVIPGIPARTPGIFIAPNSAAFFACASAACVLIFAPHSVAKKGNAVLLAFLISALAQSGTGIIVSFILFLRILVRRSSLLFWCCILITIGFAIPNLNNLTMREDYLALSGGGRIEIFFKIVENSWFSITNFGLFTNAANLASDSPDQQIAPDSLMASWFGNFGFTSIFAILLVALFVRSRTKQVDWNLAFPCVLVFVLFSFTTIIFEAFPMNIYIAVGIWAARRVKNDPPSAVFNSVSYS